MGFDVGRSSERVLRAAPEGEGFKSGFTLDLSFLSRRKKKQQSEEPLFQGPQPFIGRDLAYMALPDWRIAYRGWAQMELVEQVIAPYIRRSGANREVPGDVTQLVISFHAALVRTAMERNI